MADEATRKVAPRGAVPATGGPEIERPTFERYAGFEGVPIEVAVRVGTAVCTVDRIRHLADGDLVVLDRAVGSPFDLLSGDLLLGQVEPVAADPGIAVKLVSVAEDDDGSSD